MGSYLFALGIRLFPGDMHMWSLSALYYSSLFLLFLSKSTRYLNAWRQEGSDVFLIGNPLHQPIKAEARCVGKCVLCTVVKPDEMPGIGAAASTVQWASMVMVQLVQPQGSVSVILPE